MKYSLSFTKMLTGKFITLNKDELEEMYLEYFNDFLTIDRFSDYHNLTSYEANRIIEIGRSINNNHNK